mmetsp:Transcript_22490/g.43780  ORF Transcript_22490/g.43780 Transcript_22490/m.43780 type:complete len:158 (-) Transcript_22490:442-915(-)
MISACRKGGQTTTAQQWFDDMKKEGVTHPKVYTALIQVYAFSKDLENMDKVFMELRANNFIPDTYTFNGIIQGCRMANDLKRAELYVQKMDKLRVTKNEMTLREMLKMYRKRSSVGKARIWLDKLEKEGVKPTAKTEAILAGWDPFNAVHNGRVSGK